MPEDERIKLTREANVIEQVLGRIRSVTSLNADQTDPGDDIFHLVKFYFFFCKVENNSVSDKAFILQGVGDCWRNST